MSVNIAAARKHVEDMEEEFANNEGCHISGHMTVRRVAGKIFISAHQHQVFQMLPQLLGTHHVPKVSNLSHVVHRVGFGPAYPGQVNPLDGYSRVMTDATYAFKYFLKVVPTEYYSRLGRVTETHQYSVTEYTARLDGGGAQPPSVEMSYDLSPIVMTVNERPPSILHFLVRLCAVVGGAFAVTGMADKWIHNLVLMLGALPAGPRATRSARPTQQ